MIESGRPQEKPGGARPSATQAADFVFEILLAEDATSTTEGLRQDFGDGGAGTAYSIGLQKFRSSFARSMDLYADLFQSVFTSFASGMMENLTMTGVGPDPPAFVILVGRPGTEADAVVWIHNTSGGLVPGFHLRMTDLTRADGSRVGFLDGTTAPKEFPPSAERRRSTRLTVRVPEDAGPGIYYGHLLAEGLPDASLALRLIVQ
jgi:hypothetical protein